MLAMHSAPRDAHAVLEPRVDRAVALTGPHREAVLAGGDEVGGDISSCLALEHHTSGQRVPFLAERDDHVHHHAAVALVPRRARELGDVRVEVEALEEHGGAAGADGHGAALNQRGDLSPGAGGAPRVRVVARVERPLDRPQQIGDGGAVVLLPLQGRRVPNALRVGRNLEVVGDLLERQAMRVDEGADGLSWVDGPHRAVLHGGGLERAHVALQLAPRPEERRAVSEPLFRVGTARLGTVQGVVSLRALGEDVHHRHQPVRAVLARTDHVARIKAHKEVEARGLPHEPLVQRRRDDREVGLQRAESGLEGGLEPGPHNSDDCEGVARGASVAGRVWQAEGAMIRGTGHAPRRNCPCSSVAAALSGPRTTPLTSMPIRAPGPPLPKRPALPV